MYLIFAVGGGSGSPQPERGDERLGEACRPGSDLAYLSRTAHSPELISLKELFEAAAEPDQPAGERRQHYLSRHVPTSYTSAALDLGRSTNTQMSAVRTEG